jgi:hypothetical protein
MKKITVLLLLAIIYGISPAQDKIKKETKTSFRRMRRAVSCQQINQLKEGALIVRLKTNKKSIEALRKREQFTRANKLALNQADLNSKIIAAFRNRFNFCPVYFCTSDFSKNILNKQFEKIIFLDDNFHQDSTIKFSHEYFLTAEFGITEQDTVKYFSHDSYEPDETAGVRKVKNYYGGANMSFGALIIKSDSFLQLSKPFPYFVRTLDLFPFRRKPDKVVKIMNKKLHAFYDYVN